jgi:HTH-type transcriptional regulator/antitoxin HigA
VSTHTSGLAPRWASPPGQTIASALRERGWEPKRLAPCLDLDADQIDALLAGNLAITIRLARGLSDALGGSTEFWMAREAQYHDDLDRVAADRWAEALPTRDMSSWGWIRKPGSWQERIVECLEFFGVDDLATFEGHLGDELDATHFRASMTYNIEAGSAAVWFRACELVADSVSGLAATYDPDAFRTVLAQVKQLTREKDPRRFVPALTDLCASAGVAVVVVRAPKGCPASGAARTYSGRPLIQLSGRHLSDDHFWFTFFHEAGHVALHDLDVPIVDVLDEDVDERDEEEANDFASEWLIGGSLARAEATTRRDIIRVAHECGVSPGIVVGQLQHAGRIGHNQHNGLKRRFSWQGASLEIGHRS